MNVIRLLSSFRERAPWPTMRAILAMSDLPISRGWEDTINRLTLLANDDMGEISNSLITLDQYHEEYLLAGEKAVKIFKFDEPEILELANSIKNIPIKNTAFTKSYPLPLEKEELLKESYKTELVKIIDKGKNLFLVSCTKRNFDEHIKLNPNVIKDTEKQKIGEFENIEELVAVRKRLRQSFDILVIRKEEGYIELRIDVGLGMKSIDREQAFEGAISFFNNIFQLLASPFRLNNPINFFPLIDGLYQSLEGRICELHFTTDEGSLKYEKMRRRDIDLRNETYHKAGRSAVEHITPYRVAVIWDFNIHDDIATEPELFLPGKIMALSNPIQILEEIIVKKCCGIEDYEFVIGKVMQYLR